VSKSAVPALPGKPGGWCAVADHPALLNRTQEPTGDVVADPALSAQDEQLTVEQRFAVVPEWMLDSAVSDTAFRLYAVLARYGNTSGVRMPGRALLARRLHRSVDTVDRALKELTAAGILTVEHRTQGARSLTNRYHLRTLDPAGSGRGEGRTAAAPPHPQVQVPASKGRIGAATPSRSPAATPAAAVRPDPEIPTDTPPPTTAPEPDPGPVESGPNAQLLTACGITDLERYTEQVQRLRRELGVPSVRWAGPCLLAALQLAVKVRGWPATAARQALLLVAADTATRSPMRLAEAGPWWDHAHRQILQRTPQEDAELYGLERLLAESDDRAQLQRQAREELGAEGGGLNRLNVARRAARLLEAQTASRPLAVGQPAVTNRMRRTA